MASPADMDGEDDDEEEIHMRLQARVAAVQCLSAAEAAKMIEGMQVNEAARLVMAMPAEHRSGALMEVNDDRRAEIIAGMPAETAVVVMNELSTAAPTNEVSAAPEIGSHDDEGTDSSGANAPEGDQSASDLDKVGATEKQEHTAENMESSSVSTMPPEVTTEPPQEEASSEAATLEPGASDMGEDANPCEEAAAPQAESRAEQAGEEAGQAAAEEDAGVVFSPPPRVVDQAGISESQDEAALEGSADQAQAQAEAEAESDEVVLESFTPIGSHSSRPRAVVREGSCMDSLSTPEAARVLATVPPFEAARLALSMDEEERMAALACMPDKARKAVLGALPYDVRLAAGFIDADLEDEMLEYNSDSDEDLAEDRGLYRRRSFDSDEDARASNASSSKSAVSALSQRAMGAAGTAAGQMRHGLEKAKELASERARTSEVPAKVAMYGGKAKDAASTAAGRARQGFGRAAEKAKSSELGGRASELSGKALEAAASAAIQANEAKVKAKELGAAAADTAKAKLTSASKSIASFMTKQSRMKQTR